MYGFEQLTQIDISDVILLETLLMNSSTLEPVTYVWMPPDVLIVDR